MRPTALTVAGSDSGGGAGLQADLRVFAAYGLHGASVVTALTAQSSRGVLGSLPTAPSFVAAQLDAVLGDLDVRAAKTGMLATAAIVDTVAAHPGLRAVRHLVVDPVLTATSGVALLEPAGLDVLRRCLLPRATIVTPNLREAEALTGLTVQTPADMRTAARRLVALGARAALVTGGHLAGEARDVLCIGDTIHELAAPRRPGALHGTGCVLSAAITAALARGADVLDAVADAKRSVTRAIDRATVVGHGLSILGDGSGE